MYKTMLFTILIILFGEVVNAQQKLEKDKIIEQNFMTPPNTARPQTWWHWMNGNVTLDGIKTDLEALKSIGMGGVQLLEIVCVELNKEISLALESSPPIGNEEGYLKMPENFNNKSFDTNIC